MLRLFWLMLLICVIAVCNDSRNANAGDPPVTTIRLDSSKVSEKTGDKRLRAELSESDLVATMAFASEHHPELARLLEHLRKSRSNEFQRAARELSQQMQVLEKLKERNSPRYENQLKLWKEDSQIRVLVAKWSHSKDEAFEQQIRQLLQQRRDTKLAQLKAERQRLTDQLQKVETQMATFSESPDSEIDREWEQLAKKTNANRNDVKLKSSNKNSSN
ncbi:MAG: hypothetical protein O2856_06435 [Planctomycetota bacterium]|nr:hypothetical protein [Planctomycetota bacterium]